MAPARGSALAVPSPPAVIAHRAGNSPRLALEAIEAGADLLEADLWSYGQKLELRHERRLPRTPILFERWYLRSMRGRHQTLAELLHVAQGRIGVLLDFKNRHGAAELVRSALASIRGDVRVVASSQFWPVLRLVHELNPELEMLYSIETAAQLELFFAVAQRDARPSGVSCNQRHMTKDLVRRFHDAGFSVTAWTVNDPARACDLAGWGVDAITTDDAPGILRALGR